MLMTASDSLEPNMGKVYLTLLLLSMTYFGKYFCTSDMYLVTPQFKESEGISDDQLAVMFSMGYMSAVAGKLTSGYMSDAVSGKVMLTIAATGYTVCTIVFAIAPSNYYIYLAIWCCYGYFALGIAWVSVMSVATNWIPLHMMGRLTSIINLAPQIGDALARAVLSPVILASHGAWRTVFFVAAAITVVLTAPMILFVTNKPQDADQQTRQQQLQQQQQQQQQQQNELGPGLAAPTLQAESCCERVRPLLQEPLLYMLSILSGSLYSVRVIFLLFAPEYLRHMYCGQYFPERDQTECSLEPHTLAQAGTASALFTTTGCLSVVLVGFLKDKVPKKHRASPIVLLVWPSCFVLFLMHVVGQNMPFPAAVACVGVMGFTLFGPYKVLGTAFASDLGGKKLKATACAIMGTFDMTSAAVIVLVKGKLGSDYVTIFLVLFFISLASLTCGVIAWITDIRRSRARPMTSSTISLQAQLTT